MITLYWCRKFGQFVDKDTGAYAYGAEFRGNTMEWYETLTETIFDAINRSGAETLLMNDPVLAIVSASVLYASKLAGPAQIKGMLHRKYFVGSPGIRAIPINEIWCMKGNEAVARVVVLELGVQ
jgi:hypothetical protein